MVSTRQLINKEELAHDRWWVTIDALPPNAGRDDGWTVKDVVAHIAAWQRVSVGRISAIASGGADPGPPDDEDAFNEAARVTAGAWEETRTEALAAHRALLDLVASLSDDALSAQDGLIEFIVRVNGSGHYDEHPSSDFTRP